MIIYYVIIIIMITGTRNSISSRSSRSELSYETLSAEYVLQRSSRCLRNINVFFFFFNIAVRSMDTLHSRLILGGGQYDARIVMMIVRDGDGL